jgi:CBS domain-containing protein
MTIHNLVTVRPDDPIYIAAQLMLWAGVRHLPIIKDTRVVGVVSEADILRRESQLGSRAADRQLVEALVMGEPRTVGPDEPLAVALTIMLEHRLDGLPVVGDEGLVGMLTTTDVMRDQVDHALERPADRLPPVASTFMKRAPTVVAPDSELFDVAALMSKRGVRHLPVVDAERRVVGMVSDRDLREALGDLKKFAEDPEARERVRTMTAADVMTGSVTTVPEGTPLPIIIGHLVNERIGALPVVDTAGKLVGIVSYLDVLQVLR